MSDLTSNPIIFSAVSDGTDVTTFRKAPLNITAFVWTGMGTAADTLVLKNRADGDVILSLKTQTKELIHVPFSEPFATTGLWLQTIDSGTLYIYT